MQIINDFYMFSIDQLYESKMTADGVMTLASTWVNNTTIERFGYKRVYGTVEAVPLGFSDRVVDMVDPGTPNPKLHISGEWIGKRSREGHKSSIPNYSAAGCDAFDLRRMSDVAKNCDIQRGDRMYFDPIVTEPENYLGPHGKRQLYKAYPSDIICVVRDGKIIMQDDWCLLQPVLETVEDIMTKSGIYIKPAPGAKYLQGRLQHFREFEGCEKGDIVLHVPGLNWVFEVEGVEYYAVQREFIFAKLNPN